MLAAGRMKLEAFGLLGMLLVLIHTAAACEFGPFPYGSTGIACRMTKPAALLLNQETAQVVQTAFRNAKFPNITGERSMRLLGKVAYELTNIQVKELSLEQSEVELGEGAAIHIAIRNVTASFQGTLTYGYAGAWFLRLFHSVDFEIESSIDLQINIDLMCQKDQVAADASDCYLTFHRLTLHLQGDKEPGWLKQLFTDFISFTLKFVLKREVCREINSLAQMLANFVHDLAVLLVRCCRRAVCSLCPLAWPQPCFACQGLVWYQNQSAAFHDSGFSPALLPASRMLYFWFSQHVLSSLASAAFLDQRLQGTITGHKLQALFGAAQSEAQRQAVQKIFQGSSYNDSVARLWSLAQPRISLRPEGAVVESLVAAEISICPAGEEPRVVLYMEKEVTVTIRAAYADKKLLLHPSEPR
ncbi:CETP protein, partial [Tricholaema leucomelas]|nr:CETP protein [Tricholaema leucomelas]